MTHSHGSIALAEEGGGGVVLHSRKLQSSKRGSLYRTLPWRSFSEMDIPNFLSSTTVIGVRSSKGKGLKILR